MEKNKTNNIVMIDRFIIDVFRDIVVVFGVWLFAGAMVLFVNWLIVVFKKLVKNDRR